MRLVKHLVAGGVIGAFISLGAGLPIQLLWEDQLDAVQIGVSAGLLVGAVLGIISYFDDSTRRRLVWRVQTLEAELKGLRGDSDRS